MARKKKKDVCDTCVVCENSKSHKEFINFLWFLLIVFLFSACVLLINVVVNETGNPELQVSSSNQWNVPPQQSRSVNIPQQNNPQPSKPSRVTVVIDSNSVTHSHTHTVTTEVRQ